MFGFMKSPANKPGSGPGVAASANTSPLHSNEGSENQNKITPARRTSSEPVLLTPDTKSNPFDDDEDDDDYFGKKPISSATRNNKKKNNNRDLDSMSVQELENYAVDQAQETTKSVNNCLKIAEDIKQEATQTLDTLHHQGEQINRTHMMAVDMDRDLSKGEKLLNGLGGMFSMPWKPKKTREIKGPQAMKQDGKKASSEERQKLGLAPAQKGQSSSRTPPPEPANAMQKVEVEKAKQDDALSDLSNILGDLKGMASDMGSELDRQNKALDHLYDDVDELNSRVKGANVRARKLLGK